MLLDTGTNGPKIAPRGEDSLGCIKGLHFAFSQPNLSANITNFVKG
jgi:hypothetical protein